MIQKIKEIVLAVVNWIWQSSADPAKVSLTVRMAMLGVVAWVSLASNLFGLPNLAGSYQDIVESVSRFVEAGLLLVASVGAAFGAGRKVYLTIQRALQK